MTNLTNLQIMQKEIATQQDTIETNPYLESPKVFHLEMPPYSIFDLSISAIEETIYELLSSRETIDAYCN